MVPRKTLSNHSISLDIDATLVCSDDNMKNFEDLQIYTDPRRTKLRSRIYTINMIDVIDVPGSGIKTPMWGVFRPHVHEFLIFASIYFRHVNIWSAGRNQYVNAISSLLFPDPDFQPTIIYDWDHCVSGSDFLHKPLIKMHREPNTLNEMTFANTFALDDRDDTFSINPLNGIKIPPYEPSFTMEGLMAEDESLLQLMHWLMLPDVRYSTNVQDLDKSKIFTTPLSVYKAILAKTEPHSVASTKSSKVNSNWLTVNG
jgi:hypothetical protein